MSFIKRNAMVGHTYEPGWFLADNERCTRLTKQISASGIEADADGAKHVPMGTIYPANGSTAIGIVYEDVDVTNGDMPGSVVTQGTVYEDRLPVALDSDARTALVAKGFVFITSAPSTTRPADGTDPAPAPELEEITVESAAGTAIGDTKITVSDYTPESGESYVYKVATGTAPTIKYGEVPDYTWTAWDGTSDITAATGKKITIVSVDGDGKAVAAGSATVTAKT